MLFGPKPKVALFIDGSNFFATVEELGMKNIDYNKVRSYFSKREELFRAYYFTATITPPPGEIDKLRKVLDFLKWNHWSVITKPTKEYTDPITREITIKGNMDGEIITEMMLLKDKVDHMVLFSGDADFSYTVQKIMALGVQVTVVSSKETRPPIMSSELRDVCNRFIELALMRTEFTSEWKVRP